MARTAKAQPRFDQTEEEYLSGDLRLDPMPGEEPPLILALDDLVQDENGEVVLFNDSGLRSLAVSTATDVIEEGEAGRHVTAAGEDVSGFRYIAFGNGLRLYYQHGLDLIVTHDPATFG
ncbi:MAG: hypothetical protein AB7I59_07830 [Geminicoccaceae bacterium]